MGLGEVGTGVIGIRSGQDGHRVMSPAHLPSTRPSMGYREAPYEAEPVWAPSARLPTFPAGFCAIVPGAAATRHKQSWNYASGLVSHPSHYVQHGWTFLCSRDAPIPLCWALPSLCSPVCCCRALRGPGHMLRSPDQLLWCGGLWLYHRVQAILTLLD